MATMCIDDELLRMVFRLCVSLNYVNKLDKKKKNLCLLI